MNLSNFFFRILYGLIWLITRLPIRILLSTKYLIFPIIFYLFPYRKKIVIRNIKNSFPEWDKKQVRKTAKKFYMHFWVILIESLYTPVYSSREFEERYHLVNPEICNAYFEEGKSISLLMAHYGNWEWSVSMQRKLKHQILAIYKPLHNKYVDKKVRSDRERFGAKTVPMEKILRKIMEYEKNEIPSISFFISDQRTLLAKVQYWTQFLNQETPVVLGVEKIARRFNHAVVFLKVNLTKSGFYEVEFVPMFNDANEAPAYGIIEKYHELLEKMIREKPEYWLWSHDRWKHKKQDYLKLQEKRNKK